MASCVECQLVQACHSSFIVVWPCPILSAGRPHPLTTPCMRQSCIPMQAYRHPMHSPPPFYSPATYMVSMHMVSQLSLPPPPPPPPVREKKCLLCLPLCDHRLAAPAAFAQLDAKRRVPGRVERGAAAGVAAPPRVVGVITVHPSGHLLPARLSPRSTAGVTNASPPSMQSMHGAAWGRKLKRAVRINSVSAFKRRDTCTVYIQRIQGLRV